jgi:hypothetical protein
VPGIDSLASVARGVPSRRRRGAALVAFAFAGFFPAFAMAPPAGSAGPVLERGAAAEGAEHAREVDPWRTVGLVLGLRRRQAALGRVVTELSDPSSIHFGAHLPVRTIARRFGASTETRRVVVRYLRGRGARARIDATGAFVVARLPAAAVERIFGSRLAAFRASSGRVVAPDGDVPLPPPLRGRVDVVLGLRAPLDPLPARLARSAAPAAALPQPSGTRRGCAAELEANGLTPNQLRTAYGLDPFHRRGLKGQGQRIALIEITSLRRSDLRTYARCFGLGMPRVRNDRGEHGTAREATRRLRGQSRADPDGDREPPLSAASRPVAAALRRAAQPASQRRPSAQRGIDEPRRLRAQLAHREPARLPPHRARADDRRRCRGDGRKLIGRRRLLRGAATRAGGGPG